MYAAFTVMFHYERYIPNLHVHMFVFQNYKRQAVVALGLFVRMAAHCDISEDTNTVPLLVNLWNLANKHSTLDNKLLVCMYGMGWGASRLVNRIRL